jgi:hypothetical protein
VDQNYTPGSKLMTLRSLCHERQAEGLILFAQHMEWPWINEARDFAGHVNARELAGSLNASKRNSLLTTMCLYNWIYGLMLPGKWFRFHIVTALIRCGPGVTGEETPAAARFDCGLSLPEKLYWRIRTVLGRVLGCLPGVTSLCGWLGTCPPVEFLKTDHEDENKWDGAKPRYVEPIARPQRLVDHKNPSSSATFARALGTTTCRYASLVTPIRIRGYAWSIWRTWRTRRSGSCRSRLSRKPAAPAV